MGLSLIIKGADFSGNSVGNAFFPCYDNVVGVEFFGNLIPDLPNLKKSKGAPVLAGGSGSVGYEDYAVVPANGQRLQTNMIVPPTFTVVCVSNKSGTASTAEHIYLGTETNGPSPFQGNFVASISCFGTTLQSKSATYTAGPGWHSVPSPSLTSFNFVQFVTVDSTAMQMTDTLMARGAVTSSSAAISQQSVGRALNMYGNSNGTLRVRNLAVFNRVLSQAEMLEVHAWLKAFYLTRGVEI